MTSVISLCESYGSYDYWYDRRYDIYHHIYIIHVFVCVWYMTKKGRSILTSIKFTYFTSIKRFKKNFFHVDWNYFCVRSSKTLSLESFLLENSSIYVGESFPVFVFILCQSVVFQLSNWTSTLNKCLFIWNKWMRRFNFNFDSFNPEEWRVMSILLKKWLTAYGTYKSGTEWRGPSHDTCYV